MTTIHKMSRHGPCEVLVRLCGWQGFRLRPGRELGMASFSDRRKPRMRPRVLFAAFMVAATTLPIAHAGSAGSLADAAAAYSKGDYATALADWHSLAAQGVAKAQYRLGEMYAHGRGVRPDFDKAAAWFRKAADHGFAPAEFGLGLMYANGWGVRRDYSEAVSWYGKAAAQGKTEAVYALGLMYVLGRGVREDDVIACALFNLASVVNPPARPTVMTVMAARNSDLIMSRLTPQQIARGRELTKQLMEPHMFVKVLKAASSSSGPMRTTVAGDRK